jgi:cell division protein FtsQ
MSSEGRKRLVFAMVKSAAAVLFLCVCVWAAFEVFETWQQNPTKLKAPVKGVPVRDITLRTDGVLDKETVLRTLALPKTVALMELDLFALRERLLATGQVQTAVLARKFPDILSVAITERSPVARIMAQIGDEQPKAYLVSRDGVIFSGSGFDDALIKSLPYLDGVVLRRNGQGFAPIDGMEKVAELLGTVHTNAPQLYRDWSVVSLARLASDGEILVRAKDVAEITFGTREDFYKQIAQLDYILDEMRTQTDRPPLHSVNLAIGGAQVPVKLEQPPAPPPGQKLASSKSSHAVTPSGSVPSASASTTSPLRVPPLRPNYFSNTQHPTHRDF